jgi:hypothetical protein
MYIDGEWTVGTGKDAQVFPMDSFLENFIILLSSAFEESVLSDDFTDTSGATVKGRIYYGSSWDTTGWFIKLATGAVTSGMNVGTGVTAVAMTDYVLDEPQSTMSIDVCNVGTVTTVASLTSFDITRDYYIRGRGRASRQGY